MSHVMNDFASCVLVQHQCVWVHQFVLDQTNHLHEGAALCRHIRVQHHFIILVFLPVTLCHMRLELFSVVGTRDTRPMASMLMTMVMPVVLPMVMIALATMSMTMSMIMAVIMRISRVINISSIAISTVESGLTSVLARYIDYCVVLGLVYFLVIAWVHLLKRSAFLSIYLI